MDDHISREWLIERLGRNLTACNPGTFSEGCYKDAIETVRYAPAADVEPVRRWVPVSEALPENEKDVLIVCNRNGYRFVCPAIRTDGKTLSQDSSWNWNDLYEYGLYDEDADDYYIPEGWWENRHFNPDDVYNNPVDCEVTHWMPLPEPPKMDGGAEDG